MKIPLQINGPGFVEMQILPHQFGDPNLLTLILPEECNGKVHLPRHFFSKDIRDSLQREEMRKIQEEA